MKNYTVKAGDTLSAIAEREYGDSSLFTVISRQNHLANPNVIQVGQQLLIPYVTFRHFAATSEDTTPGLRKQITEEYYGTSDWQTQLVWEIASGVAQRAIQAGTWLLIPDLANAGHHTVVGAETLAGLATDWYGDHHFEGVIQHANKLPTTDVSPGQVLIRPGLNYLRHIAGDTLESLATEVYGNFDVQTRVAVAAAANHIGDPGLLFSNQAVYFPS